MKQMSKRMEGKQKKNLQSARICTCHMSYTIKTAKEKRSLPVSQCLHYSETVN